MIVQFVDNVTGTDIYINPDYVISLRPDPENPAGVTDVRLGDGEELRVIGDHREVADRLSHPEA
jgi:hypothetical protein